MPRFCAWAVSVFLCSRPHVKVKAVWPDVLHSVTLTPTLTPTAMGRIVPVWTEWERIATPGCFFFAAGILFLRFLALQHPGHDAADDPRRLLLHPAGRVCVDVQRKSRAAVTEHGGDRFHVHAALQRGRGEAVSQVMEPDVFQANVFAYLSMNLHDSIRMVHFAGYRGWEHVRIVRVLFVLLFQQSRRFIRDGNICFSLIITGTRIFQQVFLQSRQCD